MDSWVDGSTKMIIKCNVFVTNVLFLYLQGIKINLKYFWKNIILTLIERKIYTFIYIFRKKFTA